MSKFQLKNFFKAAYEIILVFLQFFIISLHFFEWQFFPQKQIIQVTTFFYSMGILIILIASIIGPYNLNDNLSKLLFPRKKSGSF